MRQSRAKRTIMILGLFKFIYIWLRWGYALNIFSNFPEAKGISQKKMKSELFLENTFITWLLVVVFKKRDQHILSTKLCDSIEEDFMMLKDFLYPKRAGGIFLPPLVSLVANCFKFHLKKYSKEYDRSNICPLTPLKQNS